MLGAALSLLLGAIGAMMITGTSCPIGLAILTAVPIALRVIQLLVGKENQGLAKGLEATSLSAGAGLVFAALAQTIFATMTPVEQLVMIAVYLIVTVNYLGYNNAIANAISIAALCTGFCQILMLMGFTENAPILTGSLVGVLSLLAGRCFGTTLDAADDSTIYGLCSARWLFSFGNWMTTIASIAGILFVSNNLITGQASFNHAALLFAQLLASIIASTATVAREDRVVHRLLSGIQLAVGAIVMMSISSMGMFDYLSLIHI